MPPHPERVRRSYHEIKINELKSLSGMEQIIIIKISRKQIASAMSKREIEHNILRAIHNGIFEQYRD